MQAFGIMLNNLPNLTKGMSNSVYLVGSESRIFSFRFLLLFLIWFEEGCVCLSIHLSQSFIFPLYYLLFSFLRFNGNFMPRGLKYVVFLVLCVLCNALREVPQNTTQTKHRFLKQKAPHNTFICDGSDMDKSPASMESICKGCGNQTSKCTMVHKCRAI